MLSEEDFVAQHGSVGKFLVQCPNDDKNDKLNGQKLELQVQLMTTVKELKAKIAEQTGLAVGSQKLKSDVFLKDAWTLARHNVTPMTVLELGVQTRGGRR